MGLTSAHVGFGGCHSMCRRLVVGRPSASAATLLCRRPRHLWTALGSVGQRWTAFILENRSYGPIIYPRLQAGSGRTHLRLQYGSRWQTIPTEPGSSAELNPGEVFEFCVPMDVPGSPFLNVPFQVGILAVEKPSSFARLLPRAVRKWLYSQSDVTWSETVTP
jgi:hypothetical protein